MEEVVEEFLLDFQAAQPECGVFRMCFLLFGQLRVDETMVFSWCKRMTVWWMLTWWMLVDHPGVFDVSTPGWSSIGWKIL